MPRKTASSTDETLRYLNNRSLKKKLRDSNTHVVLTGNTKLQTITKSTHSNFVKKIEESNKRESIENVYFELKDYTEENALALMDKCSIDDFVSFIG